MIIDSHCHLNFKQLINNLDEVIENACNNDVQIMQTICTKMDEFDDIYQIADKYKNIYCSVGVHPHEAENHPDITKNDLVEKTKLPKVIGIGETGLDYYYEHSPKDLQKRSFIEHIKAAQETDLPIIVHTRDADIDTMEILESEYKNAPFKGLIHCFTASYELAKRMMDIGFYISISGIITFKKATDLQESVKNIPLDRLLVETDSPYLAPIPFRGKDNQPAYTKYVVDKIAELKNISAEEVAKQTTENFFRLFSRVKA